MTRTPTLRRDSGTLSMFDITGRQDFALVVPPDIERRPQGLPAKDDVITIVKPLPKRTALKPMAGW